MARESEYSSLAKEIKSLDRDTWTKMEGALTAILGSNKRALLASKDEYVRCMGGAAGEDELVKTAKEYDTMSDAVHDKLAIVLRNVPEAVNILCKYKAGRREKWLDKATGQEVSRFEMLADGAAAWKELKEVALSGLGVETV